MIKISTILYAILFSLLTNCFLCFDNVLLRTVYYLTFIILNLSCGLLFSKSKNIRLRFLHHGTTLLVSFCVSVVICLLLHTLAIFQIINIEKSTIIHSIIYCVICNFILFWNGIICVYLTSVQLGVKIRIVGLVCGLIPIANLIVLGIIISKTYSEFLFETEKEHINIKRKNDKICQTKYPILFVHGVFFRDNRLLNYWGRIPKELKNNGAVCFYGNHQSAASVKDSGEELAERIREIVRKNNCEKVNIIAHSKGGLDCRYAIANCDVCQYVASLTTINTPHRGCLFAEWLLEKAPTSLKNKVSIMYNNAAKIIGDTKPDFVSAVNDLRADNCRVFDQNTPTPDGIYCQSVGSVMKKASSGKFPLNLSHNFVKKFDGKNDGLVGADSFEWGNNYLLLDLPVNRGISHADMIDLNRENIKGFDVREFYVNLVNELKEKGL